jgi:integrase/recombinase XerD
MTDVSGHLPCASKGAIMTPPRSSPTTRTPLRANMQQQMQLHRLAPGTQQLSATAITDFARYYWRSPDQRTPDEIRASLHHLLEERKLAWSTCNVTAAALRFFSVGTLDWAPLKLHLPPRPAHQRLPQVRSLDDVARLFACTRTPQHRALLMTTYSAGLRVSEVVGLQVTDIESDPERMLMRVNQDKGKPDRSTLLSTRLLQELRAYWRLERPTPWVCPGHDPKRPMPSGTAGQIYDRARRRAGLAHGSGIQTLRHYLAPRVMPSTQPSSHGSPPYTTSAHRIAP